MVETVGFAVSTYKIIHVHGNDPILEPYLGFIIGNWMTTLKDTNQWFELIDPDKYFTAYKQFIKAILKKPGTEVKCAILAEDTDIVIGFSVFEGSQLHYVFVKPEVRNKGIATILVPKRIDVITHLTVPGVVIWKTKLPKAIFNPFIT